ncbi:hypothetical protein [Rhizobium sullae]|uniref:Type II CBASS E2 protein domain-containing protein n=1 Tax=Rhizobium sullae TaxID=50338 RepID=A0A4R3Q0G7_RHISU|nr:hypothetical protein [Rhizobium sullae]TCU13707.1 hypothetical protein EV132_111140 [Rhizobium sullae]
MTFDGGWFATWEGTLTPIAQSYRIWIRYFPELQWDEVTLAHRYATVKVLDPLIAPDVRGTGELTPHVYRYRQPPHSPALCAWDPVDEPFNPTVYLADHVIPAVIRWLVFYEDWLDTGEWRGGGKHPDPDAVLMDRKPFSKSVCQPSEKLFVAALDRRVTRATGSATSIMAIGRASYGLFPSTIEIFQGRFFGRFGRRLRNGILPR